MSETKDSLLQIRNEKQELLGKTFHLRNSHEVKMKKMISISFALVTGLVFQKTSQLLFHLIGFLIIMKNASWVISTLQKKPNYILQPQCATHM